MAALVCYVDNAFYSLGSRFLSFAGDWLINNY